MQAIKRYGMAIVLALLGWRCGAEVPSAMNYQGRLLDAGGEPVSGVVTVRVDLFAAETGGAAVYGEEVGPVLVQNGLYAFAFGTNAAGVLAALTNAQCWLQVSIDGAPLTPRQRLLAAPYAVLSRDVEGSARWDAAYGWGNHAAAGYLTAESDALALERIGLHTGAVGNVHGLTGADLAALGALTNVVEADPVWAAASNAVLTQAGHGETAYGWGNHATGGYLKVESDPVAATQIWGSAQYPNALLTAGSRAMAGNLNMGGFTITNVSTNSIRYTTGETLEQRFVNAAGDTMNGGLALPLGGLSVGTSQFVVLTNGNVGIGTANPTNRLAVNGTVKAKEVLVTLDGWADEVFRPDYALTPLAEVEEHIRRYGHLPGLPSEAQVLQGGIELGRMQALLLRKIEELTLHVIELSKENETLRRRLAGREAAD